MVIKMRLRGSLLMSAMLLISSAFLGCGSEDPLAPSDGPGEITESPGNPNPGPPRGGTSRDPGGCPEWPQITLGQRLVSANRPVHITHAGDRSGRLFVVEQPGRIRVIRDDALLATPFLDISSRVSGGGEQGLLSIAFPPGYARKGHFYVSYTRAADGASVIARYFRSPGNPNVADANSEEVILTVEQPFAIHNGGLIAFGPDGYLYVSLGDGGAAEDFLNNAQNTDSLLGKMLRIDVESGAFPYAVPSDNPFVGLDGHRGEIWALGLRNPWRFSFDRASGDLYIADVGHNRWEEVNVQPASSRGGENYGWNVMEGPQCFTTFFCDRTGLTLPAYEYTHLTGCSVIGGFVYRGSDYPCLQGMYLYSDFCTGGVWGLKQVDGVWESRLLTNTSLQIVSFGEDEDGELYALDLNGGVFAISLQ